MYKECFGQTADRIGVLWLKSKSRGVDRTGFKLKGKKWEMHESPRTQEENLEIFKSVKRIFDLENLHGKNRLLVFLHAFQHDRRM